METSPPSSFVPADDNIFGPAAHSGIWLLAGIAAVMFALVLVVWTIRAVPDPEAAARAAHQSVKARYLAEIDDLQRRFGARLLDERQLHHELSRTVRRFLADHGAPGALAPSVLQEQGHDAVAGVVAGYQPPQFADRAEIDAARSLAGAREVIEAHALQRMADGASASHTLPAHGGDGVRGRSPRVSW
jgi:hypothetical protein